MDQKQTGFSIPAWYELPAEVRDTWEPRIDLLVPAPPLFTEIAGPAFSIDNYNPQQLAKDLSHDALLAARMLAVVNSAKYGQSQTVTSLERAMILLGFNMVKSIIVSFMMDYRLGEQLHLEQGLIEHVRRISAAASVIGFHLARAAGLADPGLTATVALMGRVGSLILGLDSNPPTQGYTEIAIEYDRIASELDQWGVTSALLSAELIHHWKIPEPLSDLVEHTWQPVTTQLDPGLDETETITLCCAAASLASATCYLAKPDITAEEMLAAPGHELLRFNLSRFKLTDPLNSLWESPRLKRELSAVTE